MTERPILFSAPMVRAILAGTKWQTRRVVTPVGRDDGFVLVEQPSGTLWPYRSDDGETTFVTVRERGRDYLHEIPMSCPYGPPGGGSRLWVREAWAAPHDCDHLKPSEITPGTRIHYAADGSLGGLRKRPGMFMPRWASRITLEITGVRVERLQDISTRDCWAEGIAASPDVDPVHEYRELWELINGRGSWESNSWVWIVEFRRVQPT